DRRDALFWLALAPAILMAALLALLPTVDPDGLIYHLTAPKRWLQAGSLVYLPTYPYTNTPMGVEMLFAIGLSFAGDCGAKVLHLMLGCAGALGAYVCGRRFGGRPAAMLATAAFLVGPAGIAPLLGCAYVEGAASFVMIAGVAAWSVWFAD